MHAASYNSRQFHVVQQQAMSRLGVVAPQTPLARMQGIDSDECENRPMFTAPSVRVEAHCVPDIQQQAPRRFHEHPPPMIAGRIVRGMRSDMLDKPSRFHAVRTSSMSRIGARSSKFTLD